MRLYGLSTCGCLYGHIGICVCVRDYTDMHACEQAVVASRLGTRSRILAVDSLIPRLSLVALAVVVARDALRGVARWSSVVLFHLSTFFFAFHARRWRAASFDRLRVVPGLASRLASSSGENVSHGCCHLDRLLQLALYRPLGALGHRGRVR